MKKKKIGIVIVVIIIGIIVWGVFFNAKHQSSYDFKTSGILGEDISDFDIKISENESDDLTKAYLESINYEIIELDTDKNEAVLQITVPQISEKLPEIVNNVIAEHRDVEYTELEEIARNELISVMESETLRKETIEIKLCIEQVDDVYKFVSDEALEQLINEELENLASFSSLLNSEWTKEQESGALKEVLTSNYWWHDIQSYNVYKFETDGTWYTVRYTVSESANPLPIDVLGEKNTDVDNEGTYIINENQVIMTRSDGYETVLDYMSEEDCSNYDVAEPGELDMVINSMHAYNYEGGFLFETDFSSEEEPWGNAMYLLPYDDMKELLESYSLSEEQLEEVKKSLNVPDDLDIEITQSQAFWNDSTERWLIDVAVYYNEKFVAGAYVDAKTAELVRNIFNYSGE